MKRLILILFLLAILAGCKKHNAQNSKSKTSMEKAIGNTLPTIGIMIFEGVLTNEVVAPLDVFTKHDSSGNALFNVVLIAEENRKYTTEEGLKIIPDFTMADAPELNVLVVPSSYHPDQQIQDEALIGFIQQQYKTVDYMASHCAGAFTLGASGVADNKKIVTYPSGGDALQKNYPKLKVMDDNMVSVAQDGKIISSNGSLVSYLASLDLLEQMTSLAHRKNVENELLLNKLKQ